MKIYLYFKFVSDVAKADEDYYRLWSGHVVNKEEINLQMDEGLAQRRAYLEMLKSYKIRWDFRMKILTQLMVSK